ncbi:hypothetical protein N7E70_000950 [Aminobacter sp. NyZ550]|jgi:hypothetical protein|uniref:hypothetical protein n=1 Tax=unclassified Aminobacter TaxID=2644704 RepID=UPI0021D5AB19|nr:hypothetical protein [Aminobacter sp. NyZ550]WAX95484.1 hypothetical protein N7E70_000950 [Aminobacter sp. NyZ550]WMC97581.1 hypothetical protein RAR13_02395 [Aminobacter aminovorans]
MGLTWNRPTIASVMPEPEQVFLAWLVAQPEGGNLHEAASRQATRLAEYGGRHPGPRRLRQLFLDLAAELGGGRAMPS